MAETSEKPNFMGIGIPTFAGAGAMGMFMGWFAQVLAAGGATTATFPIGFALGAGFVIAYSYSKAV